MIEYLKSRIHSSHAVVRCSVTYVRSSREMPNHPTSTMVNMLHVCRLHRNADSQEDTQKISRTFQHHIPSIVCLGTQCIGQCALPHHRKSLEFAFNTFRQVSTLSLAPANFALGAVRAHSHLLWKYSIRNV